MIINVVTAITCASNLRRLHNYGANVVGAHHHSRIPLTQPEHEPCRSTPSEETLVRSLRRPRQLSPRGQLDVLRFQQPAKYRAGEELEIELAPGRTPGIPFSRGRFHLV